ncbi:family 20 glycosylhydrolase [Paenibacillus eucommiae]|uniref:beta-N-acetylhexosaminidase n=1 Tax=Paenibacillus eucommiae TaxID=1355755 RepID=A0ABS4J0V6_9BACL|nr:family 20 glycosylhydrolase [Paenibacillus eucommiae]MBP1993467.1 N-acetyl-beta-hexosaminidase [Paenibacillus eucommiae]
MLLPTPKQIEYFDDKFYLHSEMVVLAGDDYGEMALQVLNSLTSEINISFSNGLDPVIEFVLSSDAFHIKEAYRIEFCKGKVVLTYGDELGARNAAISLCGLIEQDDNGFYLKACKITDYPDGEYRGVMIDLGRKYLPLEDIKTIIVQMAKAKYNTLRLHLLETEHNPVKTDVYPELNETPMQQYTKDQLKEIIEYADFFGLQIIPEIEMPAHGLFIIDKLEDLKCKTRNVEPSNWTMCVGSEKTYEILGNLIKEIAEIFPGEYIHIGTDEIEFTDVYQEQRLWPTWDDCDVCAELSRKENIEGKRELFYYFVRRIYDIVAGLGKKMMMWNDGIDISSSPNIPRDIRIQFWRVAGEGRGPVEGCSMQRFLEEGFHVVNSYYPETYLDLYMEEEQILSWHPKARPESTDEVKHLIIGGEMCAWEPNDHYGRTLPSAVFVFGDKLWGYSDREATSDYRRALTRAVLGLQTPRDFDVFESLGGILLVQDKDRLENVQNVNQSKAKLEECVGVLHTLIDSGASGKTAAGEYIQSINLMLSKV